MQDALTTRTFPVALTEVPQGAGRVPPGLEILVPYSWDVLWGAVAFVIVWLAFRAFALPRLEALLRARDEATNGATHDAEEVRREALAVKAERDALIDAARGDAQQIRTAAREKGNAIVGQARRDASLEADALVTEARDRIRAERDRAVQSLRAEVGTLSLDLASAVIGEQISADASAAVVDRFLASIEHAGD